VDHCKQQKNNIAFTGKIFKNEERTMKKNSVPFGAASLLIAGFVLISIISTQLPAGIGLAADETGMVSVDNSRDPMCGMAVSKVPKANTVQFKGKTIGFCSSHCRVEWTKLSDQEKAKKLEMAMVHENTTPAKVEYRTLSKPGTKVPLGNDHYFIYGFVSPPKLGASIMKVEIFTKAGQRDTSFRISGDADMPSMRGAHSVGNKAFSVSKKGVYLLPVNLVMPGDWEIRFVFEKDGHTVLRGAYLFDL
jgi:YHS domain-containing protein